MSLSFKEAVAEALGRWLGSAARPGRHCLRTHLPELDFPRLFSVLHRQLEHDASDFAFCAAGFGVAAPDLRRMAEAAGLHFEDVGDHLQRAAWWRDHSDATILALARGEPQGGNTIQEFATASSEDLAQVLLTWLGDPEHPFSDARQGRAPELHGRLLDLLATMPPPGLVLSLDAVCRLAAAWDEARSSTDPHLRDEAPLFALAELGIAWDGDLLVTHGDSLERKRESLRENLIRAIQSTHEALSLSDSDLAKLRTRAAAANAADRPRFEALVSAIGKAQRRATPERLREIRLDHLRRLRRQPADTPPPPKRDTLDWSDVESAVVNQLLDHNPDQSKSLFEAIAATEPDQGFRELEWDFGSGPEALSLAAMRPEMEALFRLAIPENWGGVAQFVRDQPTPALLRQMSAARVDFHRPDQPVFVDDQNGQSYTLPQLLAAWDEFGIKDLAGDVPLSTLFIRWRDARSILLGSQEWLSLSPVTLLAGSEDARAQADALLTASSALLSRLAIAQKAMLEGWRPAAEALFEAVLALDAIQLRVEATRPSQAANRLILLPTHPLQLWRARTFVAKCLEAPQPVDESTRRAIIDSLARNDLYLPAWYAPRFLNGSGAAKLLPFAGVMGGLAVFQNFENAVASAEGADDIAAALVRFAAIYPEFCRPLRVTVVNPPDPEHLLPALAACLEENKGPERLQLRFVVTGRLRARLAEARRLYLAAGGELGDAIDSGELARIFHSQARKSGRNRRGGPY